ncbi:MAG: M23 family metallopeptidase [Ruminococcus sp.]
MQNQQNPQQPQLHKRDTEERLKERGKFISSGQYHAARYTGLVHRSTVFAENHIHIEPKTKKGKFAKGAVKFAAGAARTAENIIYRKEDELQLHFERYQTENGTFKTQAKFVRNDDFVQSPDYGWVHKTVYGLKGRIRGDVPTIQQMRPKTKRGKIAFTLVKGSTAVVKGAVKLTVGTALTAENILFHKSDEIQLHFERYQTEEGKFKTHARFVRSTDISPDSGRGILHKAVGLKNRIRGDLPASPLQQWLSRQQPETKKGKLALYTAKSTVYLTKGTVHVTVRAGLAAESMALVARDEVMRIAWQKFSSKYQQYGTDDANRALIFTGGLMMDAVKGTWHHIRGKCPYKQAKKQIPQLKLQERVLKDQTAQDIQKENQRFQEAKSAFLKSKAQYKALMPSKQKAMRAQQAAQKKQYLQHKKAYKVYAGLNQASLKNMKAQVHVQKLIRWKSRQMPLLLKPVKYTGARAITSYKRKLLQSDPNNDFLRAVDRVERIEKTIRKKVIPKKHTVLRIAQTRKNRLIQSQSSITNALHNQASHLKNPVKKVKKSKKRVKRTEKTIRTVGSTVAAVTRTAVQILVTALTHPAVLLVILLILCILLMLVGCSMCTTCIYSNGSKVVSGLVAAYPMKDNSLSDAENYYTQLAWDMNQGIQLLQNSHTWKAGMEQLGVDPSEFEETPTDFIFGESSVYPSLPEYDFDPFLFWSFLCAYFWDENSNEPFEFIPMDESVYGTIYRLFKQEYEFLYTYDNTSHWSELEEYTFPNLENFQICYGSGTRIIDGVTYGRVNAKKIPAVLRSYALFSSDTSSYDIIYNIDNLEIVNAKNGCKATGWYLQDMRSSVTDPSGRTQEGVYFWGNDGRCYFEKYGYWVERTGFDMGLSDGSMLQNDHGVVMVSPTDTAIMTYGIPEIIESYAPDAGRIFSTMQAVGGIIGDEYDDWGWYKFYQAYEWTDDCRLYYTVNQKCTFEEAILQMLSETSHAEERLAYYNILAGYNREITLGKNFYGNHQTLAAPTGNGLNELLSGNLIYNGYGWDMQTWGKRHCSLGDSHQGIDILCNSGSNVYAMIDGIVTESDSEHAKIVINSAGKVQLWTEDQRCEVRITYYNVDVSSFNGGERVKAGTVIGQSTRNRFCEECGYRNYVANADYVHVKIEIYYGWLNGWVAVDPLLLIQY